MPINLPNFLAAQLPRGPQYNPDYSGIANFIPQALQAYRAPFEMQEKRQMNLGDIQKRALENALLEQYGPREKEAEIASKMAYAQYMLQGGQGGANPYYGKTALAKSMMDQKDIDEGFAPGTNRTVQLSPEEQKQLSGQNQLIIQKIGSDAKTRDRSLMANNLVIGLDALNISDLTRFSGPRGAAKLKLEQARALKGNPSPEYLAYEKALTQAKTDAKEIRQFLGESIQPSAMKALETLVNPTGFLTNPKVAEEKINAVRNLLKKQMTTYSKGLQSTKPYISGAEYEGENKKKSGLNFSRADMNRTIELDNGKRMKLGEAIEQGLIEVNP